MDGKLIALSVPFFFVLIGIEVVVARWRGKPSHRLHDAIGSLGCGVGQQVVAFFYTALTIAGYAWVQQRFAVAHPSPTSPLAWVVLLLGVDVCYYAVHRASHRVNLIWATHAVHHQSEDYNLATALRQSWFFGLFTWLFYLPLAFAGFPPAMFVGAVTLNTLYQFWIHTRTVGRMGPLEWVLNTPSHHRVHHGIDPKYIDKNYGGMLIVWDRLFGTFAAEEEEPTYGTVKPLGSFDAWRANFDEFGRIGRLISASKRLRDKLAAPFMPPEWLPPELGGVAVVPEVDRARYRKFDFPTTRALDAYVVASFALVVAAATWFLLRAPDLPRARAAAVGAAILAPLFTFSGLVEKRRGAVPLEIARVAATAALVVALVAG